MDKRTPEGIERQRKAASEWEKQRWANVSPEERKAMCEKISQTMKEYWASDRSKEARKNLSRKRGFKHSEKTKQAMRESAQKRWKVFHENKRTKNTDFWKSDEWREKSSRAMTDFWKRVHSGEIEKPKINYNNAGKGKYLIEYRSQLNKVWTDLLSIII